MDRPGYRDITLMTFVSYAQNFEDVMLWRALKHVAQGFYIDAGAWSPDIDSVTRAFYEKGWRGINIEPNPEFIEQLRDRRPHDVNLMVALGDAEGVVTMNFLSNPGLSTLNDDIAKKHAQSGIEVLRSDVQVKTLASVWREYVPAGQDVHFLKVDVEGLEFAVLNGNEWSTNRPWVVVVEATLPMTQEESYQSWEPLLIRVGYSFVYADGLNRFYVAQEHEALRPSFKYPPNVFDRFTLAAQVNAEARLVQLDVESRAQISTDGSHHQVAESHAQEAERGAREAESPADAMGVELRQLGQEMEAIRKELHDVHQANHYHWQQWQATKRELDAVRHDNHTHWQLAEARHRALLAVDRSLSWRITAPLRFAAGLLIRPDATLRKVANYAVYHILEICQQPLSRLMAMVFRRPKLAYRLNQTLMRYPALYQQLITVARRQGLVPGSPTYIVSAAGTQQPPEPAFAHLSPRARQVYAILKTAVEKNKSTN